jgi:release factor glutamine methyltransferase
MSRSIKDVLKKAEQQLSHIDTARIDAELLLAFILGSQRESHYRDPDLILDEIQYADFQSLISRRSDQFPVAYLLGHREFWSLELVVNENTLIPRPETEILVETALGHIPKDSKLDVLDLGTGSGAIAIAIAKERPLCRVLAVDVCQKALSVAEHNAQFYNLNNIRFLESDLFNNIIEEKFDLILSNPPYVAENDTAFEEGEIRYEPRLALNGGYQGMRLINQLIPSAKKYLTGSAILILEHGYDQAEDVRRVFVGNNFVGVETRQDYAGHDRVSYGRLM